MARSRRLQPGEENLWPDAQESQEWINQLAAKSGQAQANSRSRDRRNHLLEVAGIEPVEGMSQMPKHPDPLPDGGVSGAVVARAHELGRNHYAAGREQALRWEEQVRADERERIARAQDPQNDAGAAFMADYEDLDPEALPEGESEWSYGQAAYGASEADEGFDPESFVNEWDQTQRQEAEYRAENERLKGLAQQQQNQGQGQLQEQPNQDGEGEAADVPNDPEAWGSPS